MISTFARQGEKFARLGIGGVDQVLRNAVVTHHGETVFLERLAQRLSEGFERFAQGYRCNRVHAASYFPFAR